MTLQMGQVRDLYCTDLISQCLGPISFLVLSLTRSVQWHGRTLWTSGQLKTGVKM